jgi:hypothetical protein
MIDATIWVTNFEDSVSYYDNKREQFANVLF